MNFKVGILEDDKLFVNRFKDAMEEQYGNEIMILCFENNASAMVAAKKYGLSVLLKGQNLEEIEVYDEYDFPEETVIIKLCEYRVEEKDGPNDFTVCKYRNIEEWHEIILNAALSSKKERIEKYKEKRDSKSSKLCLFTSAAGGVGTTTVAAAFSIYCARNGYNTCYLNFETINSTSRYFEIKKNYHDLEDIIYGMRSNKYHMETLIKTVLVEDSVYKVSSIPKCRVQSDMFSLTGEDIVNICEMVRDTKRFDYIILDMNFEVSENIVLPYLNSDMTILVTDGRKAGNNKTDCLIKMLPIMLNLREEDIAKKTRILYNRFDQNDGSPIKTESFGSLGGIAIIKASNDRNLADKLSVLSPIEGLVKEVEKSLN